MSGTPYNGYSWKQRNRIIPALIRATGRRDPFEGAPCAICGDPNRAPAEWHSEDYSEPFSFQPPQSYPVCKPCHGRLHKRFNAAPGEWELFCRHLEAGGYGAEFVKLHSVTRRQELCKLLVAGKSVGLEVIRDRPPRDEWWRELTMDPESLEAPWARPRPLRPRPEAAAFRKAFSALPLPQVVFSILLFHAVAPRRTATMRAISINVLGEDDPQQVNLIYGRAARKLCEILNWVPDTRSDGSKVWMSVLAEGWKPQNREFEWTMVRSAADAVL